MTDKQKVQRISVTRRFLDKQQDPWEYVDEELPTSTVKIFSRTKQGTILDPSMAGTPNIIMGSMHFSGSHYDFGPGTHAIRITRRSLHLGSVGAYGRAEIEWKLRHSRLGTVDMIPILIGSRVSLEPSGERHQDAYGGPMNPLYSFGPGTIWNYITPRRGTVRVYTSLEGIVS